jgi:hypothetical protein
MDVLVDAPLSLLLRLQPVQELDEGFVDSVEEGKVIYTGALQLPVTGLAERDSTTICSVPLMFLAKGLYRVLAHVEDIGRLPLGSGDIHWNTDDVFIEVVE